MIVSGGEMAGNRLKLQSGCFRGIVVGLEGVGKIQRGFAFCSGGKSLSAAFTQTRLFWPDCVKILFLMLTYLSTLRLKTGFFLVRPKNAYFANSPNTSHRPRCAPASIRKATPRPAFDGELRKTKMHRCAVDGGSQNAKFIEQPFCHDYWLKLTLPRAKADFGIYASRREIT